MEAGKACASKPEIAVSGQKPAKRLRVKTPEKEAIQVPEMAEQVSSSKPKIFIAVSADEENAASDGSAAMAASSEVDFLEISSTSEEKITAVFLMLWPAVASRSLDLRVVRATSKKAACVKGNLGGFF